MSRHRRARSRRWVWWAIVVIVVGLLGTGAGFWQAGYRPFVVHTGSMAPTHPSGDLLIVRPADDYRVGEVITFRHSADPADLVTHRITEVTPEGFHTKGDANPSADVWTIRPEMVVGTVVAGFSGLGYAVVFLQQPTGIAAIVTLCLAIFLLWTLFFPGRTSPANPETTGAATDLPESTEPPALTAPAAPTVAVDKDDFWDDGADVPPKDELFDRLLSLSNSR